MSERLNLRGSDDKGEYVDGNVGFAHRRLSIIDVKSGHQPMTIDNGNLAIVYNGEVYNFNELRSEMNAKRGKAVRELNLRKIVVARWQEKPLIRRIITLM